MSGADVFHRGALVATGEVARFRVARDQLIDFFGEALRRATHEGLELFVAQPRPFPESPARGQVQATLFDLAEAIPLVARIAMPDPYGLAPLFLLAFVPLDASRPRQRPVIVEVADTAA